MRKQHCRTTLLPVVEVSACPLRRETSEYCISCDEAEFVFKGPLANTDVVLWHLQLSHGLLSPPGKYACNALA